MRKNIEVEFRGPLTKKQFLDLKKHLNQNGKYLGNKSRLSLMYFRKKFPKNVSSIKNDPIDLRLRVTNGKSTMVMKYGQWGGTDTRKEFEFPIDTGKFGDAIDFLGALGWTRAVVYATDAYVYQYKKIEFALIEIKNYGYNYEAEILTTNNKIARISKYIKNVCLKMGLREYRLGEFEKQCNQINNVKSLQFDFNKVFFNALRFRFKNFFK